MSKYFILCSVRMVILTGYDAAVCILSTELAILYQTTIKEYANEIESYCNSI
jgi:hypothetical protein